MAPYVGATAGKHTVAEVGDEARFHFFPSGTRGVAVTADVAAGSASGAYGRGALGGGFAFVPAPFDSPWGYEITAQVGLGNLPGERPLGVYPGGHAALLFRPGQRDTLWHQDRSPTCPLWYIGPFVDAGAGIPTTRSPVFFDGVAGIAVSFLHYDLGAP